MTEYLKDNMGRTIGRLEDRGREIFIFDSMGRQLGRYEKSNNTTYDNMGRSIGTGNLLATLLR